MKRGAQRRALAGLVASLLAIALAYASAFLPGGAPAWAAWVMVVGTAGSMVATMALGAAGRASSRLAIPFTFVFLLLAGGFCLALALPAVDPHAPDLWLGLPPAAAVIVYGIGILPLLVVPLAYALTFEGATLPAEALERARAAARGLRGEPAGAESRVGGDRPDREGRG